MPPAPQARTVSQDALQAQINSLGDRMEKGFEELKDMLKAFDTRVRIVETQEAGCQPVVQARLLAVEASLKAHSTEIDTMKATITELRHANRILTWIGGVSGAALIVWIIGQVLGLIKP